MKELIGAELDAAVALALGRDPIHENGLVMALVPGYAQLRGAFSPSTNWTQGGPLIEKYRIDVEPLWSAGHWTPGGADDPGWRADASEDGGQYMYGPTPLIAAMRAFVASKQ